MLNPNQAYKNAKNFAPKHGEIRQYQVTNYPKPKDPALILTLDQFD